ncbi:MAG: ParB/RepB/Spo0J family partition protein [Thermoguttaceae bacterium]
MQDETRDIPLDQIVEPWVVLRVVNRTSVEYMELRDSLADHGFFNSICVRPCKRKEGKTEVVDGLYRFAAATELQLPTAPCIVKHNLTDEDVLAIQIQANALRPETTPVEYARQLRKIMESKPDTMTLSELSVRIHKNPEWISNQLSLLTLIQVVQKALERGEIPLATAYAMARLPKTQQRLYLDMAKTMATKEFLPIVQAHVKKYRENVKLGRYTDYESEFEPVPYLRRMTDVLREYEGHHLGGLTLTAANCTTPLDAWYLALQWALHLDAASVAEQRERVLQRQKTAMLEQIEDEEGEP